MGKKDQDTSFPPCTPDHKAKKLDIPFDVYLEAGNSFSLIGNYSYGPSDEIDDYEKDITSFPKLLSVLGNKDRSLYPFPADGYIRHANPETGEELPYCCDFHNEVYKEAGRWFDVFPNCCSRHKRLSKNERFDKKKYGFLPKKIVLLLSQTEHLINKEINSKNWKEVICDYIDYTFICFKGHNAGLNIYLKNLTRYIESGKIPNNKAEELVDYVKQFEKYYQYSADWDYEFPILKKWNTVFPYHLPQFNLSSLSSKIMVPLPYDNKTGQLKYGATRYSLDKKKALNRLRSITSFIISTIDTNDKDLLTYSEKKELELLNEKRKLKLIYGYDEEGEKPDYVKLLEEWLSDEIEYYQQIKPLIEKMTPQELPANTETDPNVLTEEETSATRKVIEKHFSEIGSKGTYGWEYAFRRESDYNAFVDLLEKFFSHNQYELPSQPRELKHGSKTHVATALGTIHSELGEQLSSDKKYFEIVKTLSHFRDETQQSLYKALTRHRV